MDSYSREYTCYKYNEDQYIGLVSNQAHPQYSQCISIMDQDETGIECVCLIKNAQ